MGGTRNDIEALLDNLPSDIAQGDAPVIRPVELVQRAQAPDLILSQNETDGLEGAIGCECHVSSNIGNTASVSSAFASVNNSASIIGVSTNLADLVRTKRLEKGLTQIDLAERIDMSQRWVSDLERGETKMPRQPTMAKLSQALGISLGDLYVAAFAAQSEWDARKLVDSTPLPSDDPRQRVIELVQKVNIDNPENVVRLGAIQDILEAMVTRAK